MDNKIEFDDVVVVMKRGHNAVVKQSEKGREIYLYSCAERLKEGHRYDLLVEGIKTYKGQKEITHAYKVKDKGVVNKERYMLDTEDFAVLELRQNEVLKGISGIYKDKFLYMNGRKIPVYFKNKKMEAV